MPLPDAPHAHHESQAARGRPRLIRVGHHAGVAQCRRLDSVLAGECRTQQQHSRLATDLMSGSRRSASSRACRRKVPTRSRCRPSKRVTTSSNDARTSSSSRARMRAQHRTRAGVLALETLLSGHEEPRDDPRRVGREPLRAARDEPGPHRSHCGTVEKRRACCKSRDHRQSRLRALVDGSPRRQRSPSNPPPVSGSHMSCPASLAPMEPGRSGTDAVWPDRTGVDGGSTRARIGECGHLDRLLVESRPGVFGTSAAHRSGRQVAVAPFRIRSASASRSRPRCRSVASSSATPAAIIASASTAFA